MSEHGGLLNCAEATRFVEQLEDEVTCSLVNMAFVHIVKQTRLDKRERPVSDLDMLFLVKSLTGYFSEHEILSRTLGGEKVGAWFEDDPEPALGARLDLLGERQEESSV